MHLDGDVTAAGDRRQPAGARRQQREPGGAQGEGAAVGHGVARVDREVHQHLVELAGIDVDDAVGVLQCQFQPDALAQAAAQQGCEIGDRLVYRDHARLEGLLRGEGQELAHQVRAASGAVEDQTDVLALRRSQARAFGERFCGTDNGLEQVVEVVRDATGQRTDGLEFAGMDLVGVAGAGWFQRQDGAADGAIGLPHRGDRQAHGAGHAVGVPAQGGDVVQGGDVTRGGEVAKGGGAGMRRDGAGHRCLDRLYRQYGGLWREQVGQGFSSRIRTEQAIQRRVAAQ